MIEYLIVAFVVLAAFIWTVRKFLYKRSHAQNACASCPSAKGKSDCSCTTSEGASIKLIKVPSKKERL